MADEYVSQVALSVNGQEITDFKTVTIKKYTLRKAIKLMKKRGFIKLTPEYGVDVDYIVPATSPEFDFDSVQDGTLVVTYDNGATRTFTGVCTISVGDEKADDENEVVKTIEFAATGRIVG